MPTPANFDKFIDVIKKGSTQDALHFLGENKVYQELDTKDSQHATNSFQWACANKNLEIVRWLAEANPAFLNPALRNARNYNALDLAITLGTYEIARWLVWRNPKFLDPKVKNDRGFNVFDMSILNGNLIAAEWLEKQNPDFTSDMFFNPNIRNKIGENIFDVAVANGKLESAKWIAKKKPIFLNPNIRNSKGQNALDIAVFNKKLEMVKWLTAANPEYTKTPPQPNAIPKTVNFSRLEKAVDKGMKFKKAKPKAN